MGDDEHAADGSGHSNDLPNYRVPGGDINPANRTWGYSAGKEYSVHTDQLENIARDLERDLEELQRALQGVTSMLPISTQHVGTSRGGTSIVQLAQRAQQGFGQYYEELQNAYRSVIFKLYKSAGNYRKAEEYSTDAVLSVNTGSVSPSPTPTIDSTGSWS
jgi:hypothetical protein